MLDYVTNQQFTKKLKIWNEAESKWRIIDEAQTNEKTKYKYILWLSKGMVTGYCDYFRFLYLFISYIGRTKLSLPFTKDKIKDSNWHSVAWKKKERKKIRK